MNAELDPQTSPTFQMHYVFCSSWGGCHMWPSPAVATPALCCRAPKQLLCGCTTQPWSSHHGHHGPRVACNGSRAMLHTMAAPLL